MKVGGALEGGRSSSLGKHGELANGRRLWGAVDASSRSRGGRNGGLEEVVLTAGR